jgi:hypothetical protein
MYDRSHHPSPSGTTPSKPSTLIARMRTDMGLDGSLTHLIDGKRIMAVEATLVPAPPTAEHQGNHLFVNCLYNSIVVGLPTDFALALARSDTIRILQTLVKDDMLRGTASVCVTFVTMMNLGGRRRLFRYSILTPSISANASEIDPSYFSRTKDCIQSSEIDAIERLINKRA